MQIGKGRPLAVFCWLLSIVAVLYVCLDLSSEMLGIFMLCSASALAFTLVISFVIKRGRYAWRYFSFLLLALLVGMSAAYMRERCEVVPAEQLVNDHEAECEITGLVVSEEFYSNYLTCVGVVIDLPQTEGASTADQVKVYLQLSGSYDMRIGDRFSARATLYPIADAPEEQRTVRYLQAQGFILIGYVEGAENCETLERGVFIMGQWLGRLQYRLSDRLAMAVQGEQGKLASALLLGTRDNLSESTILDFRRAGAAHLLALSGLHLSLIVLALEKLLRLLRCPFCLRILLLSLVAISFLALTGFSVSMLRATFMLLCLYLSRLRGVPHDSLTALSVFLGITLTVSPTAVYDAGLWLTVLATFALICVVPALLHKNEADGKFSRAPNVLIWLWQKLGIPILSSIIILFVLILPMALIFGEMSLFSPLSNLVLTPLTAMILILGILFLPLSYLGAVAPFFVFLADVIARILHEIADVMLTITQRMSDVPGALLSLRYDFVSVLLAILVCALVVVLLFRFQRPQRFLYVLAAWTAIFVVCLSMVQSASTGTWQATYVSDKKNELLCLFGNGETVLCDVTDGSYTAYRDLLADAMPDGATEIDALILTHYHNRHISTVYKLLGDIRVRTIWLPMTMSSTDSEKAIKDEGNLRAIAALAKQRRVEVCYYLPQDGAQITDTLALEQLYFSMIKRSTHPTVSFSFEYRADAKTPPKRLTWVGASAWESERAKEILLSSTSSDTIIFSKHGPVIKTEYTLIDWACIPDIVLFADGNTATALRSSKEMSVVLRRARVLLGEDKTEVTLP